ncbi:MAG: MaoC family dehydratase N-terminal domain-containing protein [Candidatus Rokubacteria bacterium]|nr:MaoC family dehydratase N-terminal domain-containing protein [Candidatus Rokubacteria bacterium]
MGPRGRCWEDFKVGEVLATGRRTVDAGDVSRYAGLSGDFNPLHTDEEFAKTMPFGTRVAHGILTLAISNGQQNLAGWFEGTTIALLGLDKVRFTAPVKFGDTLHTEMTVRETRATSKPDRGVVSFDVVVKNQRGEAVLVYETSVLLKRTA